MVNSVLLKPTELNTKDVAFGGIYCKNTFRVCRSTAALPFTVTLTPINGFRQGSNLSRNFFILCPAWYGKTETDYQ